MTERSKILIVDDEPFNVDYLEQELEDLGYETISASNGQEALDKVAAEAPDLILLDVMMPIMDGFTVCRILKENDATRLIPIVIMTALDGFEDRIKGIEAGAEDFLTKPVNDRELLARIQTALKLKHSVDRKMGELRRVRDHFAKFVPAAVQRLVALNPEAPELAKRERDVSILFLDISGYTRLSEQLPPAVVNTLVERYFSTYLDCIVEGDGDFNDTLGDGFMATFQNTDLRRHARRSVDTALALLAATGALNEENCEHPLSVHMGIAAGTALVGSTQFEGVRGTRWTFTANGSVVNLAARLAGIAEVGHILVSPETAGRLKDRYRLQSVGCKHLKNIEEDVDIHRILGPPRRKTHLLLTYWERLRGEQAFPSRSELEPQAIAGLWPFCFVIKVTGESSDLAFEFVGSALKEGCGLLQQPAEGGLVQSATLFGKVDSLVREVLARRAPVQGTGSFQNQSGDRIPYRCIVAPLSDDQKTINYLVGLASHAGNPRAEVC